MPRTKTAPTVLTIGQLAKRWAVSSDRVRKLINAGQLTGVFRIPSAGRYGETIKIPLASIEKAEAEWTLLPAPARQKRRSQSPHPGFRHFPERIDDEEPFVESHEVDPN